MSITNSKSISIHTRRRRIEEIYIRCFSRHILRDYNSLSRMTASSFLGSASSHETKVYSFPKSNFGDRWDKGRRAVYVGLRTALNTVAMPAIREAFDRLARDWPA